MDNVKATEIQKPLWQAERRDYVYFLLTLLFSLITANGTYTLAYQLLFSMGAFCILTVALLYLGKNLKISLVGTVCLATSFILIISFAVHENTSFAFFKLLFLMLSISLFFVSSYGLKAPNLSDFRSLLSPFYLFLGIVIPSISPTARSLVSKNASAGKKLAKILLALLVGAPPLLVITLLLVYADRAFEGFINQISINVGEFISTVFVGTVILVCVFPLLFAISKNRTPQRSGEKKPYLSAIDPIFVNTFLFALSLIYLLFLATQTSYLGGGFTGLLPKDFTYAEYARRGFFEMCLVCIINLVIIFVCEISIKRADEKLPRLTRILNAFISAFSIFLIISAIAKMLMYIRSYGLTFLRLGTSIFMLLLFIAFVCMIIKAFVKNFAAMQTVLIAACIIMSLTSIAEPYNVIAEYNLYAYESGMHDEYELDTNYFAYNCGSYGTKALVTLADDENAFVSTRAKDRLKDIHNRYYHSVGNFDIRETSLARYKANMLLKEYYTE